jgi:hypothetical protein
MTYSFGPPPLRLVTELGSAGKRRYLSLMVRHAAAAFRIPNDESVSGSAVEPARAAGERKALHEALRTSLVQIERGEVFSAEEVLAALDD